MYVPCPQPSFRSADTLRIIMKKKKKPNIFLNSVTFKSADDDFRHRLIIFFLIGSPESENDINPRWRRATGKSNGRIEQQGTQLFNTVHVLTLCSHNNLDLQDNFRELSSADWKTTFVYGSISIALFANYR